MFKLCNLNKKIVLYTSRIIPCSLKHFNFTPASLLGNNFCNVNVPRKSPLDINTNIIKDVILFKYDNPRLFKMINLFAISQYIFWVYLGHFAYTSMKDAPVDQLKLTESSKWYEKINLGEDKFRNTLAVGSVVIGFSILATSWAYILRSVRYLILHKGGKDVSIVTYTPFGENRIMKVNLKNMSCQTNRTSTSVQIPIKVKNMFMYYMLDMKGEFRNPKLFDYTAGLKRSL